MAVVAAELEGAAVVLGQAVAEPAVAGSQVLRAAVAERTYQGLLGLRMVWRPLDRARMVGEDRKHHRHQGVDTVVEQNLARQGKRIADQGRVRAQAQRDIRRSPEGQVGRIGHSSRRLGVDIRYVNLVVHRRAGFVSERNQDDPRTTLEMALLNIKQTVNIPNNLTCRVTS